MGLTRQHLLSTVLLGTGFVAALGLAAGAGADDLASSDRFDEHYPYLIVDQALPEALSEFGFNLDLSVDISPDVRGRVKRYEHEGTSGEFLSYLATEHRLDWVLDRGRLFISSADEKSVRSWSGDGATLERARSALAEAEIADTRFPVVYDAGRRELSLSAPPHYMAIAAPVIDRVLAPEPTRTVNVIHGRARAGGT
ncbi:MAG: hypothetical protein AAF543_04345 [Pseudomonadota bacterium]